MQFTNSTSGNAYADGFWVGMDNTQAYLLQRENQAISFFTNATKKMAITAGGNVEIEDGNLIFASGHGIDFSATANTTNASNISELLDDYEEGTFTPEMHVEGEGQATVSNAHGIYVLVGKMVTITLRADISNPPSAASNKAWEFRNLPFTSSGHGSELYTPASIRLSGLNASHTSGWQAFLFHGSNYGRIEFFNGQNPGNASTYMNGARTHLQVTYVIS